MTLNLFCQFHTRDTSSVCVYVHVHVHVYDLVLGLPTVISAVQLL